MSFSSLHLWHLIELWLVKIFIQPILPNSNSWYKHYPKNPMNLLMDFGLNLLRIFISITLKPHEFVDAMWVKFVKDSANYKSGWIYFHLWQSPSASLLLLFISSWSTFAIEMYIKSCKSLPFLVLFYLWLKFIWF